MMKETVEIKAPNVVARFFERIMVDKKERNEEINRKIKSGEIKVSE